MPPTLPLSAIIDRSDLAAVLVHRHQGSWDALGTGAEGVARAVCAWLEADRDVAGAATSSAEVRLFGSPAGSDEGGGSEGADSVLCCLGLLVSAVQLPCVLAQIQRQSASAQPDCEEHGGGLDGFEGVQCVGDRDEVTGRPFPGVAAGGELHVAVQDLDGGFARVGVLVEGLSGGERDEGLAQDVLVTAVDGVRAAAVACALGDQ
jgi:hypothetical protein